MQRTPRICFICGPEYDLIAKCPKPPKDNEKQKRQVHFSEIGKRASQK